MDSLLVQATNWEFKNRAVIFGCLIFAGFLLYSLDPQIVVAAPADWLHARWHWTANDAARLLLAIASVPVILAAALRTWASAYLEGAVVYGSSVRSDVLVAGGPFRYVRNPLYLANVLMSASLGAMASRLGFLFLLSTFTIFSYRLIFREEAELQATQNADYRSYQAKVPRLLPALMPRLPASPERAHWRTALRHEFWFYGFPLGVLGFAFSLNIGAFFVPVALFAVSQWWLSRSAEGTART